MIKTLKFQSAVMQITKRFQDDPSIVQTKRLRFTADLDQVLDHSFLMAHASKVFKWWDILDVELVGSVIDSTEVN